MLYDNSESSVNINNNSNIEHMFEIESELKIKNLLKTVLNLLFLVLINILNKYYSNNKLVDNNSDD